MTTAAVAAERAFVDGADVAVVARADAFPDALAAASLGGVVDGPVLLSRGGGLSSQVTETLEQLGVDEVVLLGGEQALGDEVARDLAEGYEVTRVGGSNRYATAAEVTRMVTERGDAGVMDAAFLASGEDFPDALAAGPVAFLDHRPILLTPGTALHPDTAAALESLDVDRVVVLGGNATIDDRVVDAVADLGFEVERVAGRDRLATAVELAEHGLATTDVTPSALTLVRGDDFADALAAGSYAGRLGGPVVLTANPTDLGTPGGQWMADHCDDIDEVTALGGPSAVADSVLEAAGDSVATCSPVERDDPAEDDSAEDDSPDQTSEAPDAGDESDGGLREGFGGTSRPRGDEFTIPAGFAHGSNSGFAASDLNESDLEDVGTLVLNTPGEVVEGVRASRVEIQADNVTLRDSIVEGPSLYAVDAFRSGQSGFTMERVDVHQTDECRKAIYARNATFDNVNAWGGDTVAVLRSNVTVDDSFIHDPSDSCSDRHYDAVHTQGADTLHINDSTLMTRYQQQTAALIAQSNQSPINDLRLANSFVAGGTFTIYVRDRGQGAPSNVTVTNNVWQANSWQYGTSSLDRGPGWTWTGNVTTNGEPVD